MGLPFNLKPEDRADEPDASAPVEVIVPKRARSRLLAIAARLTDHQDALEALFAHVQSSEGRRLLRQAYAANEDTLKLALGAVAAVERG